MDDMSRISFKIKRKAVASEARIIRNAERLERDRARRLAADNEHRAGHLSNNSKLHNHRINTVRRVSRVMHLALGFMNDMPYLRIEQRRRNYETNETRMALCQEISTEVSTFGQPEFRNMTKEDRVNLIYAWLSKPLFE